MGKSRVLVVGIGDCGINILQQVAKWKVQGVKLLAINTERESIDAFQEVETMMIKDTLLIGENALDGMGTKGDVTKGRQAAIASTKKIEEKLQGAMEVILISGLGGGTGGGVSPVVAEVAKAMGIRIVAIPITPFRFELKGRIEYAEKCLRELEKVSNLVLISPNDILLHNVVHESGKTATSMEEEWKQMNWNVGRDVIQVCLGREPSLQL